MTTQVSRRAPSEPLEEIPPRPLIKRWWFVPAVAAAVLMGMLVLGVVALVMQMRMAHYAAAKKVTAEVARIQAAGEPITSEDFYKWHRVPEGTPDVTQAWLAALASFDEQRLNLDGKALPFVGEGDAALLAAEVPGSQLAAAEEFLKTYALAVASIHAAASMEGECRFPVEFEKGIGALLPHAQKMRSVQRLLALEARVRFERGDIDGALESISHMLTAAQTLEHQPTLIEHLVRMACLGVALQQTEFLLNETQLTEEQLARLQAELQATDIQRGLTKGMLGERGMGYNTFEHVQSLADIEALGPDGEPPADWKKNVSVGVGRPADCQKYLELLGEMIAASREPFPAARERVGQVEQKIRDLAGTQNPLEKLKYIVTMLLTPATSKAFDAFARTLARRDALICIIAAERYRLKTAAFPTLLADLTPTLLPAVPADPFDGKPLRMLPDAGELTIYSVGPDGRDDNGRENENRGEPDIVVKVKSAKRMP